MVEEIYRALARLEDKSYKRYDEIYFPFKNIISRLNSCTEMMQKEIKAIQRQLASCPETSSLIDRGYTTSIDRRKSAAIDTPTSTSIDDESASVCEKLDKMYMFNARGTKGIIRLWL